MDLKIKGITWVGNIYQKLEAICQEVDNIVRQEPVKNVENQVQTGCASMKKELLPSSVHPVEHEAESGPLEQKDEDNKFIKSLTGVKENLVDVDVQELHVDLDAIDPVENALADGFSFRGLPLVAEAVPELSMSSTEDLKFYRGNVPGNENPDVGVTENFKKNPSSHQFSWLKSVPEKDLCESPKMLQTNSTNLLETDCTSDPTNFLMFGEQVLSVETCENRARCHSLHGAGFRSLEKLGTSCSNLTNECDCSSDPSNPLLLAETYKSKSSACFFYEFNSPKKSGRTSGNAKDETDRLSKQVFSVGTCESKSPACPLGEVFQSPEKLGASYHNSADEVDYASDTSNRVLFHEQARSIETCEIIAPSCSSVHGEGLVSPEKLGTSCSNSADETDRASSPLNPLMVTEHVLSVEICENRSPTCSVQGDRFLSYHKLGTSCSNSEDKIDCVFDPSNPCPSSEQILSVETCENKVYCEGLESLKKLGRSCSNSSDESDCVSDPSNPFLLAEQIISVETCEKKSLACSVDGDRFQSHENLGTTCGDFADKTKCASDSPIPLPLAEEVLSVKACETKVLPCLVHDEEFQSSKQLGARCSEPENESDYVSGSLSTLLPSKHSTQDKVANMKLVCSSSSLATEVYDWSKLSPANFPIKEQKICNLDGDAFCVPDMSCNLPSFNLVPIGPCLNVSSETGCTLPCGTESNGIDTSEVNDTVNRSGSTGNKSDKRWESAKIEAFISFELGLSDDAGDDISGMDTIELSDTAEPKDCSFFLDNKELYAVSCRLKKLRSYRKRILDAFTSKKRRAKEYQQLAIWYGDTNTESTHTQNLLPASTSNLIKKLPTHDSCDSEWELL